MKSIAGAREALRKVLRILDGAARLDAVFREHPAADRKRRADPMPVPPQAPPTAAESAVRVRRRNRRFGYLAPERNDAMV